MATSAAWQAAVAEAKVWQVVELGKGGEVVKWAGGNAGGECADGEKVACFKAAWTPFWRAGLHTFRSCGAEPSECDHRF